MTREEFKKFCSEQIVILDGATGTNLQKAGMPTGVCPEKWITENPRAIIELQKDFLKAGTNILYAPTFGGNRIKLAEYMLADQIVELNTQLVQLSKQAIAEAKKEATEAGQTNPFANQPLLVAGDITMTGQQLYPMGDLTFEELIDVYTEQAKILMDAGVDLFVIETMMSLQETRAAIFAIREVTDFPILASLTFERDHRTLYGTPPEVAATVLSSLGVDGLGLNCSTGPDDMLDIVKTMFDYANVPILAKPNAGLPILMGGKTVYRLGADVFAEDMIKLMEAGASIVGGCCGTTPEHIKALADVARNRKPVPVRTEKRRVLTSERASVEIDLDGNFLVVGERINPTGKKKLQAELREGKMSLVRQMAKDQTAMGASILDINMGTNGIDEKEMMLKSIQEVTAVTSLPLCIDSSFPEVIEAALKAYPGRALINSISCETEKFEQLIPLAKKYGAMFILLPVSDEGIPKTIEEKHEILDSHIQMAYDQGVDHNDIVVDGLVATIGADASAAKACISTFKHCHDDLKLPTICGLSNISFGLPNRPYINVSFLVMSIASGLTMAIANPSQDLLMNCAFASDMLLAKPDSDLRYIKRMQYFTESEEKKKASLESDILNKKIAEGLTLSGNVNVSANNGMITISTGAGPANGATAGAVVAGAGNAAGNTASVSAAANTSPASGEDAVKSNPVYKAVMQGDKDSIVDLSKDELTKGSKADAVINDYLIPAINEVGVLYDQKKYFLPQLIASANAMKEAIAFLEPQIEKDPNAKDMATIVVATVEGDVHDIGKNLVALMLRNYGYNVIDLGKDVPAEDIVNTALEKGASIIGLSALMTTTMMRMKDVVELCREKNCTAKVVIGGAAVTESFADEIGADGYSTDAADCVKLVGRLLAE